MSTEIRNPTLTPVRPNLGLRDKLDLWKATRIGAVDLNDPQLPLSRKLTLALGLAGIAACGGTPADPPTTSTTEIVPTTPASTTTIEAPTTTTTSTTVPETTTTTEAEYPFNLPANITQPTGEIKDPETGNDLELGLVGIEKMESIFDVPTNGYYREWQLDKAILSARMARLYQSVEINSRGEPVEYVFLDLVIDEHPDGTPVIWPLKLGTLNTEWSLGISDDEFGTHTYGLTPAKLSDLFNKDSEMGRYFNAELDKYAQIIIEIPIEEPMYRDLLEDSRFCNPPAAGNSPEECIEILNRSYFNTHVNTKIVDMLNQGIDIPNDALLEGEYGIHPFAPQIYPFTP